MARIEDLGGDSVTSWLDVTEESVDPVLAVDIKGHHAVRTRLVGTALLLAADDAAHMTGA